MNNAIQDSNISEKDYAFSNGEVNSYQKLKGKIRKKIEIFLLHVPKNRLFGCQ